ncbi:MAG: hypothetical protein ACYCOU_02655 [Sulfobacillus sp.]
MDQSEIESVLDPIAQERPSPASAPVDAAIGVNGHKPLPPIPAAAAIGMNGRKKPLPPIPASILSMPTRKEVMDKIEADLKRQFAVASRWRTGRTHVIRQT